MAQRLGRSSQGLRCRCASISFVHQDPNDTDSPVLYKLVTIDVSWTPPPSPVKHVVLKTAIYPQYKGPVILDMTVEPDTEVEDELMLLTLPVAVSVRVDPRRSPGHRLRARISVSAANAELLGLHRSTCRCG